MLGYDKSDYTVAEKLESFVAFPSVFVRVRAVRKDLREKLAVNVLRTVRKSESGKRLSGKSESISVNHRSEEPPQVYP